MSREKWILTSFPRRAPHRRPADLDQGTGDDLAADAVGTRRGQRRDGPRRGCFQAPITRHDVQKGGVHHGFCRKGPHWRIRFRRYLAKKRRGGYPGAFVPQGIGVWTAEMILLFCLQRPDIFSYDDLAIQRGLRMVYRHREISRERFETYRRRFSPCGSVASLYLWAVSGGAIPELTDPAPARAKR